MDREELGESSSSQSVKLFIRTVQRGARGKDVCLFSDGSSFLLPSGFAKAHGLVPGRTLDSEDILALEKEIQKTNAVRKALDLLVRREHTERQLTRKLLQRGFSEDIVTDALSVVKKDGSLSEERFCSAWIQSRLRNHPEGRMKLKAGLMKAGIKKDMAERFLAEIYTREDEMHMLERAAEKLSRNGSLTEENLIKKLCFRGFSCTQVLYYIKSVR